MFLTGKVRTHGRTIATKGTLFQTTKQVQRKYNSQGAELLDGCIIECTLRSSRYVLLVRMIAKQEGRREFPESSALSSFTHRFYSCYICRSEKENNHRSELNPETFEIGCNAAD